MPKFRKKPVVVEAVQFTGDNHDEVRSFARGVYKKTVYHALDIGGWDNIFIIETLEGRHMAEPGDWIVKGAKGEFYPCKPDIFEQTYEPVDDAPDDANRLGTRGRYCADSAG
jgi:hypothetical protein